MKKAILVGIISCLLVTSLAWAVKSYYVTADGTIHATGLILSGTTLTCAGGSCSGAASYPLTAPNGSSGAPSYSFTNCTACGLTYNALISNAVALSFDSTHFFAMSGSTAYIRTTDGGNTGNALFTSTGGELIDSGNVEISWGPNYSGGGYLDVQPGGITLYRNLIMNGTLIQRSTVAGITASTTQAQGQGLLTADVNEIAAVANNNDVVTLPPAVAGLKVLVINDGSNTLQIFPYSGDNLGAGVNTSVALAAGDLVTFTAYNTVNWVTKGVTGTGSVVLATSPTLVTPTLGAATATTLNKVTVTAPASSATLTIANSKVLTVNSSLTFTGTDGSTIAFPLTPSNGGLGTATNTAHGILIGEGTSNVAATAAPALGKLLKGQGTGADPIFDTNLRAYSTGSTTLTGTAEQTIMTYTIPANPVAGTHWKFMIQNIVILSQSSTASTITAYCGSTSDARTYTSVTLASTTRGIYNALWSVDDISHCNFDQSAVFGGSTMGAVVGYVSNQASASQDFTGSTIIKVTFKGGVSGDSISVHDYALTEYVP